MEESPSLVWSGLVLSGLVLPAKPVMTACVWMTRKASQHCCVRPTHRPATMSETIRYSMRKWSSHTRKDSGSSIL
jgi:hypothetical protein